MQLLTTITGGGGFALAAICSYLRLRRRFSWATTVGGIAVAVAVAINALHLLRAVRAEGIVVAFERSFELTLLLATLIGIMGIGTHMSRRLRGLESVLLGLAALVQWMALGVLGQPSTTVTDRPWFVSHSLAFALSMALFAAGGAAGAAYLLVHRMLRRKRAWGLVGRVAPLESLERFGRWMPIMGFPLFTYGILTGLCGVAHRRDLPTKALLADLTFLLSILAWMVYAYLCFGLMYRPRIRGRRAATLATCGLGLVVLAFLLMETAVFSPLHR